MDNYVPFIGLIIFIIFISIYLASRFRARKSTVENNLAGGKGEGNPPVGSTKTPGHDIAQPTDEPANPPAVQESLLEDQITPFTSPVAVEDVQQEDVQADKVVLLDTLPIMQPVDAGEASSIGVQAAIEADKKTNELKSVQDEPIQGPSPEGESQQASPEGETLELAPESYSQEPISNYDSGDITATRPEAGEAFVAPPKDIVGTDSSVDENPTHKEKRVTRRERKRKQRPTKYQPPIRAPILTPHAQPRPKDGQTGGDEPIEYNLSAAVRVYFNRDDSVQVSILLGRKPGLPDILDAAWIGQDAYLFSRGDDWFEVMSAPDIGLLLQTGFDWETKTDNGKTLRWSLSGRQLYVLAKSNEVSGFVSIPRLVIGEESVILCTKELLPEVQEIITQTGSPLPGILDYEFGLPPNWICVRKVIPQKPIPQSEGADIRNILRPLPDIEIKFSNGIRIEKSAWLYGFPPKIQLLGDLSTAGQVLIDKNPAVADDNGVYTAAGWDTLGSHSIFTTAQNKTYSIRKMEDTWEIWDAHSFSHKIHGRSVAIICGPIVLVSDDPSGNLIPVIVPLTNPILIGAAPGQIYTCPIKTSNRPFVLGEFAPFQPIWALPMQVYKTDKSVIRILFLGEKKLPEKILDFSKQRQQQKKLALEWATQILGAGRKGLEISSPTPEIEELWQMFKSQAKAIWKKLR